MVLLFPGARNRMLTVDPGGRIVGQAVTVNVDAILPVAWSVGRLTQEALPA